MTHTLQSYNDQLIGLIKTGNTAMALTLLRQKPADLAHLAEVEYNRVAVQSTPGGTLVVGVPEGWDDVKNLLSKVIVFNDVEHVYTGWNSDRNEAYFKPSKSVGRAY
jgi:hypothetical protein